MTRDEILTSIKDNIIKDIFYTEREFKKRVWQTETNWAYNTILTKQELINIIKKQQNLKLGNVYHENGIGNNNEYPIYRELEITTDKNEKIFATEQIGSFWYTKDIFGGRIYFGINDYNNKNILSSTYFEENYRLIFLRERDFNEKFIIGELADTDEYAELLNSKI